MIDAAGGNRGDEAVRPVAVTRPRGRWSLALLGLLAAASPALLQLFDLLRGPERAVGVFFERHAPGPPPSGRVWIVRLDEDSSMRLGVDDPQELWTKILDRAATDGVEKMVVLDPTSFAPLARALKARKNSKPLVILPSRPRIDPLFELPSGVDRPLPDETDRPFEDALLAFKPDPDGSWRRAYPREIVRGAPTRALAAALAPPELAGRAEYALSFNPPGSLPVTQVWSFVRGELGHAPWRGGVLVVCRDEALSAAAVWAPHGQPMSEPRAVAQLAECLVSGRLVREIPAALGAPIFLGLFLAAVWACSRLAPFSGFLAACAAALAVLGAAAGARVGALWFFPLTPVLPVTAFGAVVGLIRRHQGLDRGLAGSGLALGQSRALHPLVDPITLDAAVLRRAVDLLVIEGVALVDRRRADSPIIALAARGDQEPFVRRTREDLPRLFGPEKPTRLLPLFSEAGGLLFPLAPEGDSPLCLYIVPGGDGPQRWWEQNREFLDRLAAALSYTVEGAGASASGRSVAPERQLDILSSRASRTEAERVLLLRLLGRLPGGVLLCDLLGRTLLRNQAVERLGTALRLAPENFLMGLLKTSSGRDETVIWRALQQVIRERAPWTFYAKTDLPEPRHHLFHLTLLDLGPAAAGVLPREILVLAATDVTGLARIAAARSKMEETASGPSPAMVEALNRMLDLLQKLLAAGGSPIEDELREMRAELDALKGGTATKKDTEAVEAVDLVAELERAVADARPIATEVGIELRVRGDDLVPMALARPEALRRALSLLLRKGVSSWRRAPTLWFQAYSSGAEVVLRMATEGSVEAGRRLETGTRISSDALASAVEEAGGRFGVGEEGDLRLAFPALAA